jgi:hypothetical protein
VFGPPVTVHSDADKDEMERKRAELERIMREITERADHYWD